MTRAEPGGDTAVQGSVSDEGFSVEDTLQIMSYSFGSTPRSTDVCPCSPTVHSGR